MTPAKLREIVGTNIRLRRSELGLTQTAVAKACGVTHTQISYIENGKSDPSLALLAQLADALSTNPQALLSPEIFSPAA